MSKKILLGLLVIMVATVGNIYAQETDKGAGQEAYEHASDESIFNRVSDWFATVGKSDAEKAEILEQRRAQRVARRAKKQARKEAKTAEIQSRKRVKNAERKADHQSNNLNNQVQERITNRQKQAETRRAEALEGIGSGQGKTFAPAKSRAKGSRR